MINQNLPINSQRVDTQMDYNTMFGENSLINSTNRMAMNNSFSYTPNVNYSNVNNNIMNNRISSQAYINTNTQNNISQNMFYSESNQFNKNNDEILK